MSRNQASESTWLRVTRVFFLSLLSRNFGDQLSSNFQRFKCWDTPSEKTSPWQLLPTVSSVFKWRVMQINAFHILGCIWLHITAVQSSTSSSCIMTSMHGLISRVNILHKKRLFLKSVCGTLHWLWMVLNVPISLVPCLADYNFCAHASTTKYHRHIYLVGFEPTTDSSAES